MTEDAYELRLNIRELKDEYESVRGDISKLKYGKQGHKLWAYWTHGKGLAKWLGAIHKWTTLHAELIKVGVPAHMADGLTTNIIDTVLPGYMKLVHKGMSPSAINLALGIGKDGKKK